MHDISWEIWLEINRHSKTMQLMIVNNENIFTCIIENRMVFCLRLGDNNEKNRYPDIILFYPYITLPKCSSLYKHYLLIELPLITFNISIYVDMIFKNILQRIGKRKSSFDETNVADSCCDSLSIKSPDFSRFLYSIIADGIRKFANCL